MSVMSAAIHFPTNPTTPIHFPTTPHAVKASALKLDKRMSVERAYQEIARNCIGHIRANEAGVAKTHDVECLHQMRVGLRRLRSAQSMFRDLIAWPAALSDEVDWLVSQLGPARDWDVLAESTLPKVSVELKEAPELAELAKAAHEKTEELHELAALAVSSERYAHLMHGLDAWVEGCGWRERMGEAELARLKRCVGKFASDVLLRDQKRLHKRGRKLKGASVETRHRVRIAAKKTRYAAEFFGSLYKQKRVKPYVKALAALQEHLGWMNDAAVAQDLLDQLAHERGQLSDSVHVARDYLAGALEQEDPGLRKAWKRFSPLRVPH
jgi:CHAD domain-containing protein